MFQGLFQVYFQILSHISVCKMIQVINQLIVTRVVHIPLWILFYLFWHVLFQLFPCVSIKILFYGQVLIQVLVGILQDFIQNWLSILILIIKGKKINNFNLYISLKLQYWTGQGWMFLVNLSVLLNLYKLSRVVQY